MCITSLVSTSYGNMSDSKPELEFPILSHIFPKRLVLIPILGESTPSFESTSELKLLSIVSEPTPNHHSKSTSSPIFCSSFILCFARTNTFDTKYSVLEKSYTWYTLETTSIV